MGSFNSSSKPNTVEQHEMQETKVMIPENANQSEKLSSGEWRPLLMFFLFNVALPIFDIGSDIFTAIDFHLNRQLNWSLITTGLILLPFSMRLFLYVLLFIYKHIKKLFCKDLDQHKLEGFRNVIWQFPILHPIKNVRQFFALLWIDSKLSINSSLVNQIKEETLMLGLYEAYLEAAPQLIFQLSLVLRRGFISLPQAFSILFSLCSLTFSSTKLFYSQRLGKYRNVDPSINLIMLTAFFVFIQNIGFVISWVILTAYIQIFAIVYGIVNICFVFVSIHINFIGCRFWEEIIKDEAAVAGVQESEKLRLPRKILIIAFLTSWIAPCSVWSNNAFSKKIVKDHGRSSMSTFLVVSCFTSGLSMILSLVLVFYVNLMPTVGKDFENLPILSCHVNKTMGTGGYYLEDNGTLAKLPSSFLVWDSIESWQRIVKLCGQNEEEMEHVKEVVLPIWIAIFFVLCSSSTLALQKLGNYENICAWSAKLFGPNKKVVHHTLINDLMTLKMLFKVDTYDEQIKRLIADANAETLNHPDDFTGDTSVHLAFYFNFFEFLNEMINRGGDPDQINHSRQSVNSIMQVQTFKDLQWEVMPVSSRDGTRVLFDVNNKNKRVLNVKILHGENSLYEKKILNPNRNHLIPLVCLLKVALIVLNRFARLKFQNEKTNIENILARLNCDYFASNAFNENIATRSSIQRRKNSSSKFKATLYETLISNRELKLKALILFGGNLNAQFCRSPLSQETSEVNWQTPVEAALENDKIFGQIKKDLIWLAITQTRVLRNNSNTNNVNKNILEVVRLKSDLETLTIPSHLHFLLLFAARRGFEGHTKTLLKSGVNVQIQDEKKRSAVHHATIGRQANILKLILETNETATREKDIYKKIPLFYAIENLEDMEMKDNKRKHSENCVKIIVAHMNIDLNNEKLFQKTPLHQAIQTGNEVCINCILEKTHDVNVQDKWANTPLHYASKSSNQNVVKLLIEKGAKLNITNKNQETSLHSAAKANKWQIVKILIDHLNKHGCDDNADAVRDDNTDAVRDDNADTVRDDNADTVRDDNADAVRDDNADTGRDDNADAVRDDNADAGRDDNVDVGRGGKADFINAKNTSQKTALHLTKHFKIVEILVNNPGIDINAVDNEGDTPLHCAAKLGKVDFVGLLARKGAKVNSPNKNGETPLDIALTLNDGKFIQELIPYLDPTDLEGKTSRDRQTLEHHQNILMAQNSRNFDIDFDEEDEEEPLFQIFEN